MPDQLVGPVVLVTGATGYVGGRLVPRLLEAGYRVRVLVRDPSRLQGRPWIDQVAVFQGDVFDATTLLPAMAGVAAAYYMIHSMQKVDSDADAFHQRDLRAARTFGQVAAAAQVGRIIYLGGLGAAVTYALWFRGIARLGPSVTALLALLSPVTAVAIGWALLDQHLSTLQGVGALVVLASVAVGQWVASRPVGMRGSAPAPAGLPLARAAVRGRSSTLI